MRYVWALLLVTGCGRFSFDPRSEGDAGVDADPSKVSISSPLDGSQVGATALLTGACDTDQPLALAGSGLLSPASTPCVGSAYSELITFTPGDGLKTIIVTQQDRGGGTSTVTRSFTRVSTPLIAHRSSAAAAVVTQGDQVDCDLVIPRPAGMATDDVLVGIIYTDGSTNAAITTPGWTRLTLNAGTYVAFFKVATAAEPAQYTFTIDAGLVGGTCESAGVIAAFDGVKMSAPIDVDSANTNFASTITAAAVTASAPSMMVVAFGANGPSSGFTVPTGVTSDASSRAQVDWGAALIGWQQVPAGNTGVRSSMISAMRDGAAALIVLNTGP